MRFYTLIFVNVLILQFTKVESQIDQLQQMTLGKRNERTLVSEFAIYAQKWLKMAAQKQIVLWVFAIHY